MDKIKGVYSAAVTPINTDNSINENLFYNHCKWLLSQDIDGLAIFGSTGEASSFNVNEKISTLEYLINSRIPAEKIIPGTGNCSLSDTIKLTKSCSAMKVKAVLVLPPFFYKNVSDEGIIEYYKKIVEEVGENNLKYILYNIPQVSGVDININIIENLIKLYPNNIIGVKDSSGNLENMLKMLKIFNNFSVFSGSDSLTLKVCKKGGAGAITATSNISGKLLSHIVNNFYEESSTENFKNIQNLQVKIRETLFSHEPISVLKALISVKNNNPEWNRVSPPLKKIVSPKNHKVIIALIELLKKIEVLIPPS